MTTVNGGGNWSQWIGETWCKDTMVDEETEVTWMNPTNIYKADNK